MTLRLKGELKICTPRTKGRQVYYVHSEEGFPVQRSHKILPLMSKLDPWIAMLLQFQSLRGSNLSQDQESCIVDSPV